MGVESLESHHQVYVMSTLLCSRCRDKAGYVYSSHPNPISHVWRAACGISSVDSVKEIK